VPLIAIPNVSEGRDASFLKQCGAAIEQAGARVLDVHADPHHNRAVFTCTAAKSRLVEAMASLAQVCAAIDLQRHSGVHPRVGGLDVCPFVPHQEAMSEAIAAAHDAGKLIAQRTGTPVYFYEWAALRVETRSLVDLRRGGLYGLMERAREMPPDAGGPAIDESRGVVCVGARDVLIAFNVWMRCEEAVVRAIAAHLRSSIPAIRALGLLLEKPDRSQVSMNLIDPRITGIDDAFEVAAGRGRELGAEVTATEIVGLVPRRWLPDPDAEAARLLAAPGRSLEDAIAKPYG
jgi:glutamate formiminotransferase